MGGYLGKNNLLTNVSNSGGKMLSGKYTYLVMCKIESKIHSHKSEMQCKILSNTT